MVLIDAAYGFADTISEIREIRGQYLPTDNAGCWQQTDARAHTASVIEALCAS